ncbi:methionine aminopeptidase [Evansella tamaricis]|uniref:Methionine aminopeptidase n=1 Tax=Evansella tamaricis TaxID=2069301 RepID=A0ABS6JCL1_9BACI|nr:methionine aminopeptidase [Evansella tamaricis]MBU9711165.1 methionine aminopeptidase [Evansella tamaricis]
MGLFNAISEWSNNRYQKKVEKMEARGHCPDCRGRGFHTFPNEYFYAPTYDCPGCNGTGSFADWER